MTQSQNVFPGRPFNPLDEEREGEKKKISLQTLTMRHNLLTTKGLHEPRSRWTSDVADKRHHLRVQGLGKALVLGTKGRDQILETTKRITGPFLTLTPLCWAIASSGSAASFINWSQRCGTGCCLFADESVRKRRCIITRTAPLMLVFRKRGSRLISTASWRHR